MVLGVTVGNEESLGEMLGLVHITCIYYVQIWVGGNALN